VEKQSCFFCLEGGVDYKLLMVAIVLCLIVIGVVVGVVVGVTRNNDKSADTTSSTQPTSPPTTTTTTSTTTSDADGDDGGDTTEQSLSPSTSIPIECTKSLMKFSETNLILKLAVDPLISDAEMDYAAAVLQKTYTALVENQLEVEEASFCDPFCRKISYVRVENATKVDTWTVVEDTTFFDSTASCTQELELIFSIGGTWVGCTGTESSFPGLFSIPSVGDNIFNDQKVRRRRLPSRTTSQHNLRHVNNRELQDGIEGCGVCPSSVDSLGMLAPSSQGLHEAMQPFITVLPAVCEIVSIELVESDVVVKEDNDAEDPANEPPVAGDNNDEPTGEPELVRTIPPDSPTEGDGTEGPWKPVDCPISFGTENCVELLTDNRDGAVPCECDGSCLIFAGGRFVGCNGDGGLSDLTGGVTGSAIINAAGCTFADHAVDIDGFACSN
jgi:hypothetical protein